MLQRRGRYLPLYIVAFASFVALGFPDGMLGVAWPSMAATFQRAVGNLGVLVFAAAGGYFVMTLLTGTVTGRLGFPGVFTLSIFLILLAALGFALAPSWPTLLIAALLSGAGGGLLDGGLNAYAATRFGPRELNWLHACYGLGATISPMVMTSFVVSGASWRGGYVVLTAIGLVVLVFVVLVRSRWTELPELPAQYRPVDAGRTSRRRRSVLVVALSIFAFFVYTGAEAVAGQWSFSLFTIGRGLSDGAAGGWVTAYFAALTGGRLFFGWLGNRVRPMALLRLTVGASIAGALLILLSGIPGGVLPPVAGGVGLAILGFALAPMFPLLVGLTPGRVGTRMVGHVVGFQIAAAGIGAFTVSGGTGFLVEVVSIESVGAVVLGSVILLGAVNELVHALSRRRSE